MAAGMAGGPTGTAGRTAGPVRPAAAARRSWPARCLLAFGLSVMPMAAPAMAWAGTAAASGSQCVALVVDRAPGSYGTNCVPWSSGMTGLDVLQKAGHAIQFRQDGLLCRIDGYPGTCTADATHYWSYWHRTPGSSSWIYSTRGAGSYQPPVGATEGWAYLNGVTRPPASVAFTTICPPPATTAPRTTTAAAPRPPPIRTSTRATTAPAGGGTGPAQRSTSGGAGRTASTRPAPTTRTAATSRPAVSSTPAAGSSTSGSPSTTPVAAVVSPAATHRPSGSPLGLLGGLALVAGIGGAAVWYARRRRAPT
jgi:hypothetical protein